MENVVGSLLSPIMQPEMGFNDFSKTVKFIFGALPMVGIAPVSVLTLQGGEVSGGSFRGGGKL